MEKEKEENIWRRSLQKLSRILRSLGLETFANLRRDSVSDSENFVSVLASKKFGLGFGFGKFSLFGEKKSRYGFRSKFWYCHSVIPTQWKS